MELLLRIYHILDRRLDEELADEMNAREARGWMWINRLGQGLLPFPAHPSIVARL